MDFNGRQRTKKKAKTLYLSVILAFNGLPWTLIGGSAWESNPPGTLFTPHTGFEVQEAHQ